MYRDQYLSLQALQRWFGEPICPDLIAKWKQEQLIDCYRNSDGSIVYHLGDVIDRMNQHRPSKWKIGYARTQADAVIIKERFGVRTVMVEQSDNKIFRHMLELACAKRLHEIVILERSLPFVSMEDAEALELELSPLIITSMGNTENVSMEIPSNKKYIKLLYGIGCVHFFLNIPFR